MRLWKKIFKKKKLKIIDTPTGKDVSTFTITDYVTGEDISKDIELKIHTDKDIPEYIELDIEEKDVKPEDIKIYGFKLTDWKSIKIKDTEMILYYNPIAKNKENGFNFYCIEPLGWTVDTKEIINCECVFFGTAYFDGIRHLYFGDHQTDNYGYLYYPKLNNLLSALKELKKLEIEYCREIRESE